MDTSVQEAPQNRPCKQSDFIVLLFRGTGVGKSF